MKGYDTIRRAVRNPQHLMTDSNACGYPFTNIQLHNTAPAAMTERISLPYASHLTRESFFDNLDSFICEALYLFAFEGA